MSSRFIPIEKADIEWQDDLPFSKQFQDIYFSKENGLAETLHVFIQGNQLIPRWEALKAKQQADFVIAETGFGTGLNFLLTCKLWLEHAPEDGCLHYISCEKYPLSKEDLIKAWSLWPELKPWAELLIKNYPVLTPGSHLIHLFDGRVKLNLMLGDVMDCYRQLLICGESSLESALRERAVDAWYLDGFAPAKNEWMWTSELFEMIALLSKQGSTLATFSAAKVIKDQLKQNGFSYTKPKGFGRKRDMISAVKDQESSQRLKKKMTPWHHAQPLAMKEKKALIIGAGLSGCFNAYALAKRGWKVSLLDEKQALAQGASAIHQAVLFPKFSAYDSPLTAFMLMSFLYASRFYQQVFHDQSMIHLDGALLLSHNEKESLTQSAMQAWLAHYPELGLLLDQERVSELAGVPLPTGGLFVPDSGWVDTAALCHALVESELISYFPRTKVDGLHYNDGQWQVAGHETEVLILANGYQCREFSQTQWLPVKPIRGQMTSISSNPCSESLNMPVCANGHLLPAVEGRHWLGATYDLGEADPRIKAEDDRLNLERLNQYAGTLNLSTEVLASWASVRGATPDYLPLVGPVVDPDAFKACYSKFSSNSKRWIPQTAAHYPGLYIAAAFGSRGLSTIPLSSEYLASLINHEFIHLPQALAQAISPSRFLKKSLDRA